MDDKDKKIDTYARKMGYICGGVLVGCAMASIVAVTIKFLSWLF